MAHVALARKWRPHRFEDVVGQTHVVRALTNALTQQYLHHAYLLTGTRGVGKTTIARILAKCLNCEQGISATPCGECSACTEIDSNRFVDLFEIDAASRTKVEDTREILDNVQYTPSKGRYKVYLIDEVHMLSGHSFNALLKTLEEPPEHVLFILATTDPQRLPATVLSRCLQFHLMQMPPAQISEQLEKILKAESIGFESEALTLISEAAEGSMRDALSLLDQGIAFGNGQINADDMRQMLGTIARDHLDHLLQSILHHDANALLAIVDQLAQQGADFSRALTELLSLLHQISVEQLVGQSNKPVLQSLAQSFDPAHIQLLYQIAVVGQRDLAYAPTPRIGFEMTLLRMLAFIPDDTPDNPTARTTGSKNQSQQPSATIAKASGQSWAELLPQLGLRGAALILAQQCALANQNEHSIALQLDPKQKALLNSKYVTRIEDALSQLMQKPMKVSISLSTPDAATPAELQQRLQQEQQAIAETAIYNDQTVQRIVQAFDATVVKESIVPLENQTLE